jgi:hypothetical protein
MRVERSEDPRIPAGARNALRGLGTLAPDLRVSGFDARSEYLRPPPW